jgi:undecaprenyl-diphosphatase
MKKKISKSFCVALALLAAFAVWTVLLCLIDVQRIGPNGSSVGFASLNGYVHSLTGVNMSLYVITDWLGLVPMAAVLGFAALGLTQWIKRKSIFKVDRSILALDVFYMIVIAVYLFFEAVVINYRPVLIEGVLEASYPSSTTVLAMCVMPTAAMQLRARIKNYALNRCAVALISVFTVFMVLGRLISGVHWLTDIIGGTMFSTGLVMLYYKIGMCE